MLSNALLTPIQVAVLRRIVVCNMCTTIRWSALPGRLGVTRVSYVRSLPGSKLRQPKPSTAWTLLRFRGVCMRCCRLGCHAAGGSPPPAVRRGRGDHRTAPTEAKADGGRRTSLPPPHPSVRRATASAVGSPLYGPPAAGSSRQHAARRLLSSLPGPTGAPQSKSASVFCLSWNRPTVQSVTGRPGSERQIATAHCF